jgi:hypothetical protein
MKWHERANVTIPGATQLYTVICASDPYDPWFFQGVGQKSVTGFQELGKIYSNYLTRGCKLTVRAFPYNANDNVPIRIIVIPSTIPNLQASIIDPEELMSMRYARTTVINKYNTSRKLSIYMNPEKIFGINKMFVNNDDNFRSLVTKSLAGRAVGSRPTKPFFYHVIMYVEDSSTNMACVWDAQATYYVKWSYPKTLFDESALDVEPGPFVGPTGPGGFISSDSGITGDTGPVGYGPTGIPGYVYN